MKAECFLNGVSRPNSYTFPNITGMWLLNAHSKKLEHFVDETAQAYAILSHTWEDGEVSFQDISNGKVEHKKGYAKIHYACNQAVKDGLHYAWVDTCCIDKTSSAELSEAINSMYRWYYNAVYCYAFLSDAPEVNEDFINDKADFNDDALFYSVTLGPCRWFTRGWTLQELLAPSQIKFYGDNWTYIGNKSQLYRGIVNITGINEDVLISRDSISSYSVAERMGWAAGRQTSRVEDRAYSLLGLFDANMPLIYGEGTQAFRRLQEEIIKEKTDHTIFVWNRFFNQNQPSLLASSPDSFARNNGAIEWRGNAIGYAYSLNNRGLEISLPLFKRSRQRYCGILQCRYRNNFRGPVALSLRPFHGSNENSEPTTFYVNNDPLGRMEIIAQEEAMKAPIRTITILKRFREPFEERRKRTSQLNPKIWLRIQNNTDSLLNVVKWLPEKNWISPDVFDTGQGDSRVCVIWTLKVGSINYKFAVAIETLQASPTSAYPDPSKAVCRLASSFLISQIAEQYGFDTENIIAPIDEVLKRGEDGKMRYNWFDIRAEHTLTERMGEYVHMVSVTIDDANWSSDSNSKRPKMQAVSTSN